MVINSPGAGFLSWQNRSASLSPNPFRLNRVAEYPEPFQYNFNRIARVQRTIAEASAQVVDARAADRFRGEAPEPRAGLPSGHIPGSLNVPHATLVRDGTLKPADELAAAFAAGGVDLDRPVLTSCGSGVSAAVLWLALHTLGREPVALYDGSWTEWAGRGDLPIATGTA